MTAALAHNLRRLAAHTFQAADKIVQPLSFEAAVEDKFGVIDLRFSDPNNVSHA